MFSRIGSLVAWREWRNNIDVALARPLVPPIRVIRKAQHLGADLHLKILCHHSPVVFETNIDADVVSERWRKGRAYRNINVYDRRLSPDQLLPHQFSLLLNFDECSLSSICRFSVRAVYSGCIESVGDEK